MVTKVGGIRKSMILWQAVFLAASPLVTAPPSNLTRLYYNGFAAKSHSTTTKYRQLRRLITPRDLAVATRVTRKSASVGETVTVLSLCRDPINMNSLLVIFRVSLFALSQLWTFSKSSVRLAWILWILLLAYVRWVSSAYPRGSQFERQLGRSLINNRNNNGPKIVPRGTPQLKEQLLERRPLMEHICVRSSKYDWNQWCAIPLIP